MKNLVFLTLLVIPGLTGVLLSGYWGYADFMKLTQTERNFQQLVISKPTKENCLSPLIVKIFIVSMWLLKVSGWVWV